MQNITVTKQGSLLRVTSPFHPNLARRAQNLGGKWNTPAAPNAWAFDPRDEARLRELLTSLFGSDGSPVAEEDLLTVRATPAVCDVEDGGASLWLCGRMVARAFDRDGGAKLGEGVVLVSGKFVSRGSRKHPEVKYSSNCTFEVRDVPRKLAEALHDEYHGVTLLDGAGAVVQEPTSEVIRPERPAAEEPQVIAHDDLGQPVYVGLDLSAGGDQTAVQEDRTPLTCQRTLNDVPCGAPATRVFYLHDAEPNLRLKAFCAACAEGFLAHCGLFVDVDVREVDAAALGALLSRATPVTVATERT